MTILRPAQRRPGAALLLLGLAALSACTPPPATLQQPGEQGPPCLQPSSTEEDSGLTGTGHAPGCAPFAGGS